MRIEFDNTKAIVLGECDSDNETYQKVRRATKAPAPWIVTGKQRHSVSGHVIIIFLMR